MISRFSFALLMFALSSSSLGEQFRISESFLSKEFNHPTANKVHRDVFGSIWIATQDGLITYDGTSTKRYDTHQNDEYWIPESNITHFSEDSKGRLYILTFSGKVLRQKAPGGGFSPLNLQGSLENSKVRTIEFSADTNLLIGHERGLVSFDPKFDTISNIFDRDTSIGVIHEATHLSRTFFLCSSEGLIRLEVASANVRTKSKVLIDSECTSIAIHNGKAIYIATESGRIIKANMDGEILATVEIETDARSLYVSDLLLVKGLLLIASDYGLFSMDKDLNYFQDISRNGDGLSSLIVQDLLSDKDHLWIATLGGINILTTPAFEASILKEKLTSDITAFAEDSISTLWVGSYDGLWSTVKNSTVLTKFTSGALGNRLLEKRVTAMSYCEGKLWIGFANGGVQVLDIARGVLSNIRAPTDNDNAITGIEIESQRGTAWISTSSEGLWKYQEKTLTRYPLNSVLPVNRVTNLAQTNSGSLLAFAERKLYRISKQTGSFEQISLDFNSDIDNPVLYSFTQSSNGTWWIGTKDYGLFKSEGSVGNSKELSLSPAGAKSFTLKGSIYCIEIDDSGFVWVASDSGLSKLTENGRVVDKYSEIDGLQGDQFNLGSSLKTSNGEIVMGGLRGYNLFNPSQIRKRSHAISIQINQVSSLSFIHFDTKRKTGLEGISANHKQIRIDFTSLDFTDPTKNQYRYKLENFDEDWVNSGSQNSATYTNLPSGNYRFVVQAANSSGIWNTEGASIDLVVLPPPWLTWWAYCLYIALAALMLWGLHRIYYSFAIARKANELAFEMHLAEERADDDMQEQIELQQDLVQSAYEHNKTTLALISDVLQQRSATTSDTEASIRNTSYQSRMDTLSFLEECLYFQAGGSVVDLYKLTEGIFEQMLPKATVEPDSLITINQVTKQLVPATIASPVALLICELVENAILHAFSNQSPANYVQVGFSRSALGDPEGDFWLLEVSDNGVGADLNQPPSDAAHSATKEAARDARSGFGLQIVHQLADQLGASVRTKSAAGSFIAIQIPAS